MHLLYAQQTEFCKPPRPRHHAVPMSQVAFLDAHPEVDGVGGSVQTFKQEEGEASVGGAARVVDHPCEPGMVMWSLLLRNLLSTR